MGVCLAAAGTAAAQAHGLEESLLRVTPSPLLRARSERGERARVRSAQKE
jgi:hypothetical protein